MPLVYPTPMEYIIVYLVVTAVSKLLDYLDSLRIIKVGACLFLIILTRGVKISFSCLYFQYVAYSRSSITFK